MKCPDCGEPLDGVFVCWKCQKQGNALALEQAWLGAPLPESVLEWYASNRPGEYVLKLKLPAYLAHRPVLQKIQVTASTNPSKQTASVTIRVTDPVTRDVLQALWGNESLPF